MRLFKAAYVTHIFTVTLMLTTLISDAQAQSKNDIRLVLQITIDGLRADLLNRYQNNFGKAGFRYLMDTGVVYTNAHYQHANTETIVGHTTLATGAFPAAHGMVGNAWFDREAGEQVDPTQKASRTQGRSPKAILAATFGDGLAAYYGGRSKIFGVSGKDRSAVSMAGHVGKAFWFSTDSGDLITSTYYYDVYPDWVQQWNGQRKADQYTAGFWHLLNDKSTYLLAAQDDRPYEADLKGYGRTFPHSFGETDDKLFYTRLLVSPVGDQLILDFSKQLISNEQLGQDDIPDYLSISFSSVDAVNHFFGPSSLENEDVVLQLDRTLADLFEFVDKEVGLEHTLIVLSADHGMADMPEYMTELGYDVGRLDSDKIVRVANQAGKDSFGVDNLVRFFFRPYLYLDVDKITSAKLTMLEVEKAIATALSGTKGIALAVPSSGLGALAANPAVEQVRRNYHPARSGDIYIAQQPYWFLFEKGPIVAMHGSPWRYDTHVPIIFAGSNIRPKTVNRLVHPVDVAPTLTGYLGLTPPSSAQGTPLAEVLQ